ncbi:single-stranded DNA-binding protein [Sphingobacteriales bacterium UPWRP_1]|nr:single-stranded DNA-binding protein [Sphingobacteriales bacterium TSM_CSM]PSJ76472.1 single-stranded DNA-binding protein [Sphingobacteriales bacterium UPWRP_1]
MSLNKVLLVGNLGKDPEIQNFESGSKKASFSLATSERYTNRDGQSVENTEWHNIVCWGKLAEIAEKYLQKGKMVFVEGKIKTRSWEDKEGNKRYITEIEANSFQMLGSKGTESSHSGGDDYSKSGGSSASNQTTPPAVDSGDDLPF